MTNVIRKTTFLLTLCGSILAFESAGIAFDGDDEDPKSTTTIVASKKGDDFPWPGEDFVEASVTKFKYLLKVLSWFGVI